MSANVKATDVAPLIAAKPVVMGDMFTDYMAYLRHTNSLVEKTYQLEKAGAFAGAGTPEGKAFIDERLAAGATELRDMIYTAWVKSADPVPQFHGWWDSSDGGFCELRGFREDRVLMARDADQNPAKKWGEGEGDQRDGERCDEHP